MNSTALKTGPEKLGRVDECSNVIPFATSNVSQKSEAILNMSEIGAKIVDFLYNKLKRQEESLQAIYAFSKLKTLDDDDRNNAISAIKIKYPLIGILLEVEFAGLDGKRTSELFDKKIDEYLKCSGITSEKEKQDFKTHTTAVAMAFYSGKDNPEAQKEIKKAVGE